MARGVGLLVLVGLASLVVLWYAVKLGRTERDIHVAERADVDGFRSFRHRHTYFNDPLGRRAECERAYRFSYQVYLIERGRAACAGHSDLDICLDMLEDDAYTMAAKVPWDYKGNGCQYVPENRKSSFVDRKSAADLRKELRQKTMDVTLDAVEVKHQLGVPASARDNCVAGRAGPAVVVAEPCAAFSIGYGYLAYFDDSAMYEVACRVGAWPLVSDVLRVTSKIEEELQLARSADKEKKITGALPHVLALYPRVVRSAALTSGYYLVCGRFTSGAARPLGELPPSTRLG